MLGVLAAWVLSSGLASVLFVVGERPIVYGAAATNVALVGLTAALIPAIRPPGSTRR